MPYSLYINLKMWYKYNERVERKYLQRVVAGWKKAKCSSSELKQDVTDFVFT